MTVTLNLLITLQRKAHQKLMELLYEWRLFRDSMMCDLESRLLVRSMSTHLTDPFLQNRSVDEFSGVG